MLQCVSPNLTHREVLRSRAISVANGVKRKSRGRQDCSDRLRLTHIGHSPVDHRQSGSAAATDFDTASTFPAGLAQTLHQMDGSSGRNRGALSRRRSRGVTASFITVLRDRSLQTTPGCCLGLILIELSSVAAAIITRMPARLSAICMTSPSERSTSAMWLASASRTPRQ